MVARDFESPDADSGSNNVYNYTLIATDDDGNSGSLAVAVTVTDVTESASLTLSGIADSSQPENSAYTSATPSLSGTPIGSVTYTLGGDDAGLFTVNSSTGVVEMVARDFESPADSGSNNVSTTHSLPPMTMPTQTASLLLSPSPMSPNRPLSHTLRNRRFQSS